MGYLLWGFGWKLTSWWRQIQYWDHRWHVVIGYLYLKSSPWINLSVMMISSIIALCCTQHIIRIFWNISPCCDQNQVYQSPSVIESIHVTSSSIKPYLHFSPGWMRNVSSMLGWGWVTATYCLRAAPATSGYCQTLGGNKKPSGHCYQIHTFTIGGSNDINTHFCHINLELFGPW